MSSRTMQLGLLAFVSSAVAIPQGFFHHRAKPSGSGVPFEAGNITDCTMVKPSGTGRAGHHHHRYCVRPTGSAAVNEALGADSTALDTALVTRTSTNIITVTMTGQPDSVSGSAPAADTTPAAPATSAPTTSSATDVVSTVFASSVAASTANAVEGLEGASSTLNLGQNAYSYGQSTTLATSVAPSSASTPVAPTPSAASSASSSSSGSGSGSKRGVAYNDAQYVSAFSGKKASWAYNWVSSPGNLPSGFEYVAMLWGTGSNFVNSWQADAEKAIVAGSNHLMAFNEPDLPAQANLSPAAAATAYKTYMHDMFGGSNVRLGSPAVTNGGGSMGLSWLTSFMTACSGCQVDFVTIHWYDSATNIDYFKSHVQQAHTSTGKAVWLTEFGASGSDDQINTFLQTVIPWLESQDYVERYAYFMAKDGLLNSGTGLSSYGNTYATA